jgi:hypothetical protein
MAEQDGRDAKDVKVDRTIAHDDDTELRTTVGEQLEARRDEEGEARTAPAHDPSGPTRPIGNEEKPVNMGGSGPGDEET